MNNFVQDFHKKAAVASYKRGASAKEALAVASAAVFNRLNIHESVAIAESQNFEAFTSIQIEFSADNIQIDEAGTGGIVVHGTLLTAGKTPIFGLSNNSPTGLDGGWSWSEEALYKVAEAINTKGIFGVLDAHKGWRADSKRESSESVVDWVKAKVVDGKVQISARLKQGFEWVANKLRGMSIEAFVNKSTVRNNTIYDAEPVAFTFVKDGVQKRPENKVYSVTSD